MERSLVRIGDCSEGSRCFITEICCALLIYIERQSSNGQAGRSHGNKMWRELGRKEAEAGEQFRKLSQLW